MVYCWRKFWCSYLVVYMHLRLSLFQPSSHFSCDTHSKQSFCLDKEGFLWLSLCSFGPWSNSFDLCRTLHALDASLSCICASCISLYALLLFLHLILLLCFCFCVCKNPKTTKKVKNSKSLIIYIWSHVTCDFGLVPSYKWRSTFTSLTCFVYTSIFVGKILTSMCDLQLCFMLALFHDKKML